ncbi:2Fe-2S iron-sulfur cluster-binding protein [Arthrobacter sp. NPDC080031]|uniref:2Fe-2S iron-sulfur cluster-binding protein n=1 Tax=Arthrobacter sp. NPDC080031 TaxID=3155918 RepID=UPI00345103E3
MPTIHYISADGDKTSVDVLPGKRVMQTAQASGVDGIVGECGGQAMCATCHVYVGAPWQDALQPLSDAEDVMLEDTVCERTDESRLSCQIVVTEELDGITIRLPKAQI